MSLDDFDAATYLERYPEVLALGMDAKQHYENFGKRLGYVANAFHRGNRIKPASLPSVFEAENDLALDETFRQVEIRRRLKSVNVQKLEGAYYHDMVSQSIGDVLLWTSTGTDPQMLLHREGVVVSLLPGEYLIYFKSEIVSGQFSAPKLYLDFGDGFSEQQEKTMDFIPATSGDEYFAVVNVASKIERIRFDPSVSDFKAFVKEFIIETFEYVDSKSPILNPSNSRVELLEKSLAQKSSSKDRYKEVWRNGFGVATGARSPHFAPLSNVGVTLHRETPKVVAFYLPQFHPFPENDEWWGRGFTEWTNVSKSQPQFVGHYQPRLPGELGFYDLRLPDVMKRQIQLAKQFGIGGFCFHYYWFGGKRLLERPIEDFLKNKSAEYDFPFCLCWANENWTRRWDGAESDVLMAQKHSDEDNRKVFEDLLRFFKDSRYILVDGKPMITIYRPGIITGLSGLIKTWRAAAVEAGFPGIYLVATNAFGCDDAAAIGFDALVEFPPHGVASSVLNNQMQMLNDRFEGQVYDYQQVVDFSTNRLETLVQRDNSSGYFPTVMTGWDNEARKPGKGHVFHGATPEKFYTWLSKALDFSKAKNSQAERFVFVNAWNEWAEGTYLEPDRHFGYAYLHAVASALRSKTPTCRKKRDLVEIYNLSAPGKSAETAVCVHVFYPDLIDEIASSIAQARKAIELDVFITVPTTWDEGHIRHALSKLSPTKCVITENVGRDVWPFIQILREVDRLGYKYGCKIHSKKSPHLANGALWRQNLYNSLLSIESIDQVTAAFNDRRTIGICAAASSIASCKDPSTIRDNRESLGQILGKVGGDIEELDEFVAGTMFWFRVAAFKALLDQPWSVDDFGPELGAIDGTIAHAFERAFPYLASLAGFGLKTYEIDGNLNPYAG